MDLPEMLTQRPMARSKDVTVSSDSVTNNANDQFAAIVEAEHTNNKTPNAQAATDTSGDRASVQNIQGNDATDATPDPETLFIGEAEKQTTDLDAFAAVTTAQNEQSAAGQKTREGPLQATERQSSVTPQKSTTSQRPEQPRGANPALENVGATTSASAGVTGTGVTDQEPQTVETASARMNTPTGLSETSRPQPQSFAPLATANAASSLTQGAPQAPQAQAAQPQPDSVEKSFTAVEAVVRVKAPQPKPGRATDTSADSSPGATRPAASAAVSATPEPAPMPPQQPAQPRPKSQGPPDAPNISAASERARADRASIEPSATSPAPTEPKVETSAKPTPVDAPVTLTARPEQKATAASTATSASDGTTMGTSTVQNTPRVVQTPSAPFTPLPAEFQAQAFVERQIAPQIVSAAGSRASGGLVEIMLDPPELGRIEITIELSDQTLRATIAVERTGTNDLLRRHLEMLSQQFAEAGFDDVDLGFGTYGGNGENQPAQDNPGLQTNDPRASQLSQAPSMLRPVAAPGASMDIRL